MKKALALITYSRIDCLNKVLDSINNQILLSGYLNDIYDVYIFQDGLFFDEPENQKESFNLVTQTIKSLPHFFNIIRQKNNLGIGMHYDFIEKFLFTQCNYDFVIFLEDDLVLSKHYISTIDLMATKFYGDSRVGMISAFPVNPSLSLENQSSSKYKYSVMGHNWGYGVYRSFWEARQPFIDEYIEIIQSTPYQYRNHSMIRDWLDLKGFVPAATSQDYIKSCATYALGAIRLSTTPNFAIYIGKNGEHFTDEIYARLNLDNQILFPDPLDQVGELNSVEYYRLLHESAYHQVGVESIRVVNDEELRGVENLK